MAIKSADQITIVDLTDAYAVMLSSDSTTVNGAVSNLGKAQTITVNVFAYRGDEQLSPSVGKPTCPANVTATVGSESNKIVPVTITFAAALAASGKVSIPVTVGDVTIVKDFTFAIAFKGNSGAPGADAITMVVTSSNGTIFKNTAIATTLTARVYKAGAEVTGNALTALGQIKWYKDGGATAVSTGQSLSISAGDVSNKAVYEARLEG